MRSSHPFRIAGTTIPAGSTRNVRVKVCETYFGDPVSIHLRVMRAREAGPTIFVTAAIHGDELNGTGIVHELITHRGLRLKRGTLILVPVVNVLGFESNTRYLPDRRDLNRSFPGCSNGSMAGRLAHALMQEVVSVSDHGIDLHTAAIQRTNFPNVRGDLKDPAVLKSALAFGCELLVHGKGPDGSFRREACRVGCPTITLEAGEPWKIEPAVLDLGVRGVRNILASLDMIDDTPARPAFQAKIFQTHWIRAELGGILRFHVSPGQLVRKGQPIASNFNILGRRQNILESPLDGIILGMTTMPTVKPGEPICHVASLSKSLAGVRRALLAKSADPLHQKLRHDIATNFSVTRSEA